MVVLSCSIRRVPYQDSLKYIKLLLSIFDYSFWHLSARIKQSHDDSSLCPALKRCCELEGHFNQNLQQVESCCVCVSAKHTVIVTASYFPRQSLGEVADYCRPTFICKWFDLMSLWTDAQVHGHTNLCVCCVVCMTCPLVVSSLYWGCKVERNCGRNTLLWCTYIKLNVINKRIKLVPSGCNKLIELLKAHSLCLKAM